MIDYDQRAREWLAGRLEPSIGREAWVDNARRDAELVASILEPYDVSRLLEVGCGFGRMSSHLAERFTTVLAVDTSPGMVECTERVARDYFNLIVYDQLDGEPYPVADAALCFDVIDADWSLQQADDLVASLLRSCPLVLVGVQRLAGWSPRQEWLIREGDAWWLLQGDVV